MSHVFLWQFHFKQIDYASFTHSEISTLKKSFRRSNNNSVWKTMNLAEAGDSTGFGKQQQAV